MDGEGDVKDPRVGGCLGEGGVITTRAADQSAAGAATAGCKEVAARAAVEKGRAGGAADQSVGTATAVEAVAAEPGLDQVVLGAAFDRVVAEASGEANVLGAGQRAFDDEAVVAGAEVGHHPARGATASGSSTCVGLEREQPTPTAIPFFALTPKVEVASSKARTRGSGPPPPTNCSPPPPPE